MAGEEEIRKETTLTRNEILQAGDDLVGYLRRRRGFIFGTPIYLEALSEPKGSFRFWQERKDHEATML